MPVRVLPALKAGYRFRSDQLRKLHLLDLAAHPSSFILHQARTLHDVNILDHLVPEPGAFYIMDRAYVDFEAPGKHSTVLEASSSLAPNRT